ncbi:MAG: DUF1045 domain-containing protein [Paracoccaceae bacterium]
MSEFQRYAVYYLPDHANLASFGASWLGWDVVTGTECARPELEGLAEATAAPHKYGFHGTLKPPFKLADGTSADALAHTVAELAQSTSAFELERLQLACIGTFLALVPVGDTAQLAELALSCVTKLDHFRRPADQAELQRRRAAGLSARQEAMLTRWGYPYVAEEFRFHLTLSGKLDEMARETFRQLLNTRLPPLPAPFPITSIALVGEQSDGTFKLIQRSALGA